MSARELLHDLHAAGYVLRLVAGKVRVTPPGYPLPDDVRAQILAMRDEIVAVLDQQLRLQVRLVAAKEWIADLVAKGQLPSTDGNPWATLRRSPPRWHRPIAPLPLDQLRRMPVTGVVARLCLTADRLGRLIEQGMGDGEEAQELAAERQWISLHRPEAWDQPVRPPPP